MLDKETIINILNSEEFQKTLYDFIYDLYHTVYSTDFNTRFLVVYLVNDPNTITIKIEIEQERFVEKIRKRHFVLFELDGLDLILLHASSNNIETDLQIFAKKCINDMITFVNEFNTA